MVVAKMGEKDAARTTDWLGEKANPMLMTTKARLPAVYVAVVVVELQTV
jgi:hypothetical protein